MAAQRRWPCLLSPRPQDHLSRRRFKRLGQCSSRRTRQRWGWIMARRAKVRHIKSHRCYTVAQAADCVGVTEQTIRRWGRQGLRVMSEGRPSLILGADLKLHIENMRATKRPPVPKGQFRCRRCGKISPPALGYAEYHPLSVKHGLLKAFCGACEAGVTRIVSSVELPVWSSTCEIVSTSQTPA